MADIKTPEERSQNMAKIRSKDTKPEEYIRKKLYSMGYRYRKNTNLISGHPDLWISKYNTAIFVNGCFWHRHKGCKFAYKPKSRIEFWSKKFESNVERDRIVKEQLTNDGIRTLIIWECTTKSMRKSNDIENTILQHIDEFMKGKEMSLEL